MVQAHDLPDDVIRSILMYYHEFQVADMTDRLQEFRSHYGLAWGQTMEEVRSTPQFYLIYIQTHDDTFFSFPLNVPHCDFTGVAWLAERNAWAITAFRTNTAPE